MDSRTKGLPHATVDIEPSEIAAKRWNVLAEDLPLPLALLRSSALMRNRRWMREFLTKSGARLAPHGKTYMSPQIFQWLLEDGAWAITLSTAHQIRVARAAGVDRILLANEMVGVRDIEYILDELRRSPKFEFICLVDSVEGVDRLVQQVQKAPIPRPLQLLIEVGYREGRTGCRDQNAVLAVGRRIRVGAPHVELVGVEGFEGLHGYLPGPEALPKVRGFLKTIVQAAERLDAERLFDTEEVILSAGGSAYYDLVIEAFAEAHLSRKISTVLRGGCWFTHDSGWYERLFSEVLERSNVAREIEGRLDNALEVWAYVLSVPEPGRAILGAGRRDFGHDAGPPVPLKQYRPAADGVPVPLARNFEIVGINDQHAHLSLPEHADVQVGDMIALGVSHPCTTFDKWRLLHVVDDHYDVVSAVQTWF